MQRKEMQKENLVALITSLRKEIHCEFNFMLINVILFLPLCSEAYDFIWPSGPAANTVVVFMPVPAK